MRNRKEIAIDSDIEDVEISIDLQCAVLSVLHVQTLHLNTSRELTIALIECGGGGGIQAKEMCALMQL